MGPLRIGPGGGETGDLAAASGRVRLLDREVCPDQKAHRPADGFLRDPGQRRKVAKPRSFRVEDSQQVGADGEGPRRFPLVLDGERQQYPGQQRRQRQVGEIHVVRPRSERGIRSPAEQARAKDRQAIGQPGVEQADHGQQRVPQPTHLPGAETLSPALLDEAGKRPPCLPRPQAPGRGAEDGVATWTPLVDLPSGAVDGDVTPAAHAVQVGAGTGDAQKFADGDRLVGDEPHAVLPHHHGHQPGAVALAGRPEVRRAVREAVFGFVVERDRERDQRLGQQGR